MSDARASKQQIAGHTPEQYGEQQVAMIDGVNLVVLPEPKATIACRHCPSKFSTAFERDWHEEHDHAPIVRRSSSFGWPRDRERWQRRSKD